LRRLKKKLQDNLSLSSKLFLRGLYSTSTKTAGRLAQIPGRVAKRVVSATADRLRIDHLRRKAKGHSLETPTLATADFDLTANLPASQQSSKQPAGDRPAPIQTSIIIPVFNKAEFTFQCITSLKASRTDILVCPTQIQFKLRLDCQPTSGGEPTFPT